MMMMMMTMMISCLVDPVGAEVTNHVNVWFSGQGASQVGERIGSFQWLVIHKDMWLVIHLSRCRVMRDFCLLGADGKPKL